MGLVIRQDSVDLIAALSAANESISAANESLSAANESLCF
jgi:hypothetical protein